MRSEVLKLMGAMMSELEFEQDQRIEAVMRSHLSAQLDPQRGRAGLAFRQHIGLQGQAMSIGVQALSSRNDLHGSVKESPWWWRRGPWALAMVGSALAASLLTAWAAPVMWGGNASMSSSGSHGVTPFPSQGVQSTPVTRMDETVQSHIYDGGTYVLPDGTPVRRLRRLNIHERNWRNEATGERVRQVVPSEDQLIYEMKTY